jgi:hypothetical protein
MVDVDVLTRITLRPFNIAPKSFTRKSLGYVWQWVEGEQPAPPLVVRDPPRVLPHNPPHPPYEDGLPSLEKTIWTEPSGCLCVLLWS